MPFPFRLAKIVNITLKQSASIGVDNENALSQILSYITVAIIYNVCSTNISLHSKQLAVNDIHYIFLKGIKTSLASWYSFDFGHPNVRWKRCNAA